MNRLLALALLVCATSVAHAADADSGEWRSLFNGKDLDGWTPKTAKHPVGDNYANTFRVEDGVIKVSYDKYEKFDRQFGHLYTNQAYSNYILRLEYKITGKEAESQPIGFRNIQIRQLDP